MDKEGNIIEDINEEEYEDSNTSFFEAIKKTKKTSKKTKNKTNKK